MPKSRKSKLFVKLIITALIPVVMIMGTFSEIKVLADDKCKDIENTEKRLKCYQEVEEKTQKKLTETRNKLTETQNRMIEYSTQLNVTQAEINQLSADIQSILGELDIITENLSDTKEKLSDKIDLRNKLLRNYSKKSVLTELELFFSDKGESQLNGFQFLTFVGVFNKATNEETLKLIAGLNSEIKDYEADMEETEDMKNQLIAAQSRLITLRADLDNKKVLAEKDKTELEEEEGAYEKELEQLQNKILSLKQGSGSGTVGDYDSPQAKTPSPPFKPAFAAFSYGAYTHYKGMSQYGAKGRAEDGQSYEDILNFYYGSKTTEKSDFPSKICVEGYGDMDFQKYLYGLGEMPSNWPKDALKAQAIAARSYAYRYVKAGKCICITQSCQVFIKSKSDNTPDAWKKAVDDTKNEILKDTDTVAYYSSTTGGHIENIGWDVKGEWPGGAYEIIAKSPWFYKAWYTKSYADSSTCGHSHPWLTEKEMADILNSWVVWTNGSSSEKSHISPLTKDCWGGDPYSMDKMAERAAKYGGGYSKVTSVRVDISNSGYTSQVYLTADGKEVPVDGQTFKTVFNLRAPAYVAIRSRLFDFEKEN